MAVRLGNETAIAWADTRIHDLAKTLELARFTRRVLADVVLRETQASPFARDLALCIVEADDMLRRGPSPAVGLTPPLSSRSASTPTASSPSSPPSSGTQPPG